jgi:uncharacterized repeat protein (TIGR03803 family)
MIDVNGTFYGTTSAGGGTGCAQHLGCGTVFALSPASGTERVLHAFTGGSADGAQPWAALTNLHGTLYGTTPYGGQGCGRGRGCGSVFRLDRKSGVESLLYAFSGTSDGATPYAGLTALNGLLAGNAATGGSCPSKKNGCGTTFQISTTGMLKVLHTFAGGAADGALPRFELIERDGTLYGTTPYGGADGFGTAFSLHL